MADGYRLLACDLDGTLLDSAGALPGAVSDALGRAVAAGLTVAVITARPPRDVPAAIRAGIPPSAYWAHGNGALVFRPGEHRPSRQLVFDPAVPHRLAAALGEAWPDWALAFDLLDGTVVQPGFPEELARHWNGVEWRGGVESARPVVKLLAYPFAQFGIELVRAVQELVGIDAEVTASGPHFLELGPRGTGKHGVLAWIAADLGLDLAQTAAVGDGLNDCGMIRLAGLGAAPANAPEAVRSAADRLLPSNDEHAVAHLVDQLLG
ncbi:HAD hydrolase family protein [Kitasatospora sp. NPDC127059]|uniref:HAD hydrolase family protein n=1 Tax=unclassified Kitasatospora TaxID=2633591 RepID=UPI0036570C64